jgi:eukaryotic-like serine/threonine-protein kinase
MSDLVGQTLGNYRIEALLGSGGMGEVYRGVHVHLNRPAAIKVMRANLAADSTFQARFRQEAQAAAALTHPHIVEVYEFGEQENRYYLVLELVPDGSLRTLLQRRAAGQSWPLALGLELVRQTAEGLAYAQERGMVHRDVKPDNLLLLQLANLGQQTDQYTLKISDFGLAKLTEGTGLTATGTVMGTPAYMSPEQCQGSPLDGRGDLYSLGVVLYEVATGYLPFQAKTLTEAAYKHVHLAPPPPRQVRPDLPAALEQVILRCLAKKPEDRYPTGSELAQALREALVNPELATMAPIVPVADPPHLRVAAGTPAPAGTALQAAGAGKTPPPVAPDVSNPSRVPRVRVQDKDGKTLHVVDLTSNGLTIGREQDNDVVLQQAGVSRHHVRVDWTGEHATVTDLGSSNGTWMAGVRLLPQAAQPWAPEDALRVGRFWLRLLPSTSPAVAHSPLNATVRATPSEATVPFTTAPLAATAALAMNAASSGRLSVLLEQETLALTPGQPSVVKVTLANLGGTVDHLKMRVEGVPAEWVQGPGQEVPLNPGAQETIQLVVSVARAAANRAGEYPVQVRALSREYPGEWAGAQARWTVLPFNALTLALRPSRASGRGQASYGAVLRNEGNTPETCQLSGEDDEQKLTYAFAPEAVGVEAGNVKTVPVKVRTRRHWVGKEVPPYPFTVRAISTGGSTPQPVVGQFVNLALLPGWVPAAAGVALAGVLLIALVLQHLPPAGGPRVDGRGGSAPTATTAATVTATATVTPTPTPTPVVNAPPTPIPIPPNLVNTPLATNLDAAIGSAYNANQDRLIFVEYSGKISAINNVTSSPSYHVLGTGYTALESVAVTSDGRTAYVTERTGDLLRVDLSNADQAAAIPVSTGMDAPHQIVLDEASGNAYIVEFADPGGLFRIDLSNGNRTQLVANLPYAIGLLLSADRNTAYVSQQLTNGSGQLSSINLSTGSRQLLASSSGNPFFMLAWATADRTGIFVPERAPASKLWLLDMTAQPANLRLVSAMPDATSVVVLAQGAAFPIAVCNAPEVDKLSSP